MPVPQDIYDRYQAERRHSRRGTPKKIVSFRLSEEDVQQLHAIEEFLRCKSKGEALRQAIWHFDFSAALERIRAEYKQIEDQLTSESQAKLDEMEALLPQNGRTRP